MFKSKESQKIIQTNPSISLWVSSFEKECENIFKKLRIPKTTEQFGKKFISRAA